jgi:hypothetical protein
MWDPVTERYKNDATFRSVVDHLEALIHAAHFTPMEVRQAAMLAAINYEMHRRPEPIYIPAAEIDKWFYPDARVK